MSEKFATEDKICTATTKTVVFHFQKLVKLVESSKLEPSIVPVLFVTNQLDFAKILSIQKMFQFHAKISDNAEADTYALILVANKIHLADLFVPTQSHLIVEMIAQRHLEVCVALEHIVI